MQRCGIRIRTPEAVKVNIVILALSGITAVIPIIIAISTLPLTCEVRNE